MQEQARNQIINRWKEAFGQYDLFRSRAEPAVVAWEYTQNGCRHSPLPHQFKRYPPRPRAFKQPPDPKYGYFAYGLDAEGRPRVEQIYTMEFVSQGTHAGVETFFHYTDDLIEIVKFSPPPHLPMSVEQIELVNNRVLRRLSFALSASPTYLSNLATTPDDLLAIIPDSMKYFIVESYEYTDGLVNRIHETVERMPQPYQSETVFHYDDRDKLEEIIEHFSDGHTQTLYRAPNRGSSVKSMKAQLIEQLTEAIINSAAEAHTTGPITCMVLIYRDEEQYFPPLIELATESNRSSILSTASPNEYFLMFMPVLSPDARLSLQVSDPAVLGLCATLTQALHQRGKLNEARGVLQQIAARLTRHDWTGTLPVTPDFVCYAIDYEVDALTDALLASTSEAQIQEWSKKGWLPRTE